MWLKDVASGGDFLCCGEICITTAKCTFIKQIKANIQQAVFVCAYN